MKQNRSSATTPKAFVRGVRVALIRKNSPRDLLLRQLREYFLYSKLRSMLPSQPVEVATEYEPPLHEIPGRVDSDEENACAPPLSTSPLEEESIERNKADDDDDDDDDVFDYENENENIDVTQKTFVPSIKIKRMDQALLISTVVLKDLALSSGLFRVLEEEKLDIVFENQYRTETKVSHTIQVRVPSEYDTDALERKLQTWARTGTHT